MLQYYEILINLKIFSLGHLPWNLTDCSFSGLLIHTPKSSTTVPCSKISFADNFDLAHTVRGICDDFLSFLSWSLQSGQSHCLFKISIICLSCKRFLQLCTAVCLNSWEPTSLLRNKMWKFASPDELWLIILPFKDWCAWYTCIKLSLFSP